MWVQVLGGAPAEMCSHYRELVVKAVVAVAVVAVAVEAAAVVVLVNVGGWGGQTLCWLGARGVCQAVSML